MKTLLLRLGVLGTVVMLGWITIANAQRGSDNVNPLRASAPPVDGQTAPSALRPTPLATEPATRRPTADPFGLQAQRNAEAPPRYPRLVAPVSAEQPAAGPSLIPGGSRRVADDQEPAPFRADPFAMPANSTRASKTNRGGFAASANSGRAAEPFSEGEGEGRPGEPRLEGPQSPQLTIQKFVPKEIQVGKPAVFRVTVRNTGSVPAGEVEVRDQVPRGTRLLGTTPQAQRGPRGELTWTLGTIQPGEETSVTMQLMPTAEGEIGSVATARFGAEASARTIATRPQLVVETTAPAKVLIGDPVTLSIVISNPGTGVAAGVVLEERIPPGLRHSSGSELEYAVGDLKPGESRKLELSLVADRAGPVTNLLGARGDGSLRAESKCQLEVVAPQLDVVVDGPKRRFLERQATYQLSVSNPGTAAARQVELVASLPRGLKFLSANNAGYYEESSRTVRWRLEELPANETGSVKLVTMPVEAGQHAIKLRGTAQKGLVAEREQPVLVEGIAAILFQVADMVDPVEIGGQTTYEVRVVNQGSKSATNVRLAVLLPPELKPVAAEGPSRFAIDGNRVIFDGLSPLAPKAVTTYRIKAKALQPGDLRIRFQLTTDDMQTPVTKEESTRVYADE